MGAVYKTYQKILLCASKRPKTPVQFSIETNSKIFVSHIGINKIRIYYII